MKVIHNFLSNCTKSVPLDFVTPCVKVEEEVLGPLVSECYSCSRQLVSYLTTEVKLYTCAGVKKMEKVALQCKECSMIYNPVQFGNNHQVGFQWNKELLKSQIQSALRGICWTGNVVLHRC